MTTEQQNDIANKIITALGLSAEITQRPLTGDAYQIPRIETRRGGVVRVEIGEQAGAQICLHPDGAIKMQGNAFNMLEEFHPRPTAALGWQECYRQTLQNLLGAEIGV